MSSSEKKKSARGADKRERIAFAEATLAGCLDRRQTEDALRQRYGVSARQARRYIRAVRERWAEEAKDAQSPEERSERRGEIRGAMRHLYQRCLAEGDLRGAERALWRLAELDGLTSEEDTPKVVIPPGPTVVISYDEAVERARWKRKI